ncbi:MAG: hypothetical protein AAF903_12360 [Pseudomonadota bacterium]
MAECAAPKKLRTVRSVQERLRYGGSTYGIDWSDCAVHLREPLYLYLHFGKRPEGYVLALLCNDMAGVFKAYADQIGMAPTGPEEVYQDWDFIRGAFPAVSHGSKARVNNWRYCRRMTPWGSQAATLNNKGNSNGAA